MLLSNLRSCNGNVSNIQRALSIQYIIKSCTKVYNLLSEIYHIWNRERKFFFKKQLHKMFVRLHFIGGTEHVHDPQSRKCPKIIQRLRAAAMLLKLK